MKTGHEEILNTILASRILEPHIQHNPSLGVLLGDPENPNIHYGSEFIPTIYQKKIFERRAKIKLIDDADEISKTNAAALQKVLTFIEKYPKNNILTVTFNCNNEHFTVWCGLLDNFIEALCVMKGGHIPDYAFEVSES
jgi:hypothetical protein